MEAHTARMTREGYLYGLAAYGLWGLVPLYFALMRDVPPLELLAHRIVWSLLFLVLLLAWFRAWPELKRCLTHPVLMAGFLLTALLVGVNWYVFIHSVEINEVRQASLGYYITPLVSVVLGLTFLRESLRPVQAIALVLAALGVGYLIWQTDRVPWISLSLAGSFGLYGLVRKRLRVDGLVGLSIETIILLPLALGYLGWLQVEGIQALGHENPWHDALLLASGVVTAVPLLCFGQAAQRLPLSALGFMQYMSPTIQMVLAITVFGEEPLPLQGLILVWIALVIFTIESVHHLSRGRVKLP